MGTPEELRAASREGWSGVADGWERHADRIDASVERATAWMLEAAALEPGERVLEIACGPAGVGLEAARAVAPGGRVLITDFAETMLDAAQRRAAARGIDNVDFRVLDAEEMDLDDGGFDAVVCRFGYMLMADPGGALANTCRVLRPGGRLAIAVWDEGERNPWSSLVGASVMEHFEAPPPEPDAPGQFALADPERLTGLIEGAGFERAGTERIEAVERFDSLEDWWDSILALAGPLATMFRGMPGETVDQIRARAYEKANPYVRDDGMEFPSAIRVAAARRPG